MQYLSGLELAKRDPDWTKKVAVGGLLLLSGFCIPFVGQLVLNGWLGTMMQRTVRGQEEQLPRLDLDFDYLMRLLGPGFRHLIVSIVWVLPLLVLGGIMYGCLLGGVMYGSTGENGIAGVVCPLLGSLFMVFAMIPYGLVMACAVMRTQLSDDISTGFQVGPAARMAKAMWKEMLLGGIVLWFVSMGISLAGLLLCCVGIFFAVPLIMIISSNYNAHIYREYIARGGEAVKIAHLREADPQGSSVGPRPQAF